MAMTHGPMARVNGSPKKYRFLCVSPPMSVSFRKKERDGVVIYHD